MQRNWLRSYPEGVPSDIEIPEQPLPRLLEETALRYPARTAISFMGTRLSYAEIDRLSSRFAAGLGRMGVKKGDRVAIHLPNCPQFVIAYYGTLKAGGVVVPTNPLYTERELEHQLRDSGAETVVTLSLFYRTVMAVKEKTNLRQVIVTYIKDYFPPLLRILFSIVKEKKEGHRPTLDDETITFANLLKNAPGSAGGQSSAPGAGPAADDLACLLYTGGTTGVPKGAMLTHRNLLANALQIKHWMADLIVGEETILAVLPLFHAYAMTTCLNYGIKIAATLVLLPKFEIELLLKTISESRPTVFPGVPTLYAAVNNHPAAAKYNLRSIKYCVSGAAAMPAEVQRQFEERSEAKILEGYGLSEASPVTHVNPANRRKAGSIGVPLPGTLARVVDLETGTDDVAPGQPGELLIQGPQVMGGYWNNSEDTAAALRDGWLYTGDIAEMDEDGYFKIVDRKKEMIIAGGFNIYPREIEEVLYANPKVKEAAAIGIPHPYRGETVKVFVVLKDGQTASEEEIIAFCREHLAKYKVPEMVEFRQSLPKTLIGKILRRLLAEEERTGK